MVLNLHGSKCADVVVRCPRDASLLSTIVRWRLTSALEGAKTAQIVRRGLVALEVQAIEAR